MPLRSKRSCVDYGELGMDPIVMTTSLELIKKQPRSVKKFNISQSNELTEAAYSLSLQAKRVLWLCLLQSHREPDREFFDTSFTVNVQDYEEIFRVARQTASSDVTRGINDLLTSFVEFHPKNGEFDVVKRNWLSEAGAKLARGVWCLNINERIMPFINGLTESFTFYSLADMKKLNSVKTIRLYECFCQYGSTGMFVTDHEWICDRFKLPDSQRNNFAELKRTFLNPAIKKINDHMPLKASYKRTDNGKLIFTIVGHEDKKS